MPMFPPSLVDQLIADSGVAVFVLGSPTNRVHTIGNTEHQLPELLTFCTPDRNDEYRDLFIKLSTRMVRDEWSPPLLQPITINDCTFSCIEIDLIYIAHFVGAALAHYNYAPLRVLQLLTRDANKRYPYELAYDPKDNYQPFCKTH